MKSYAFVQGEHFAEKVSHYVETTTETMALIDIYFGTMKVATSIENWNDSLIFVISDLGGQFGLWLGVTVASVLEIVSNHFDTPLIF